VEVDQVLLLGVAHQLPAFRREFLQEVGDRLLTRVDLPTPWLERRQGLEVPANANPLALGRALPRFGLDS
jgi:hypothetical protein